MDGLWSYEIGWEIGLAMALFVAGIITSILATGYGLQNSALLVLKRYPKYPVLVYWATVLSSAGISIATQSGRGLVLYYLASPVLLIIFRFGRLDQIKNQEDSTIKTRTL